MNQQIRVDHRDKLVIPSHLFPDQLHRDIRIGAHICSCLRDRSKCMKKENPHTSMDDLTDGNLTIADETTQDPKCRNYL